MPATRDPAVALGNFEIEGLTMLLCGSVLDVGCTVRGVAALTLRFEGVLLAAE